MGDRISPSQYFDPAKWLPKLMQPWICEDCLYLMKFLEINNEYFIRAQIKMFILGLHVSKLTLPWLYSSCRSRLIRVYFISKRRINASQSLNGLKSPKKHFQIFNAKMRLGKSTHKYRYTDIAKHIHNRNSPNMIRAWFPYYKRRRRRSLYIVRYINSVGGARNIETGKIISTIHQTIRRCPV